MSILNFAFFGRNSNGEDRSGEGGPAEGSEAATASVRLRRLLEADTSREPTPESAKTPVGQTTDESVVSPIEATPRSGSSETHAHSIVTNLPVPPPESSDERMVEQHRPDASVLLAPVDAGHDAESEARRASEIEIARLREQLARVQEETEKHLSHMNHQLAATTDKAQTAIALKQTAELEISRIREETKRQLARMEEQLEAAGHQVQVEAARRRASELEIARLRQEIPRRSTPRGDEQATKDEATATASDLTTAAGPRGDVAPPFATALERPKNPPAKSKKTTTSGARTRTSAKKRRTGTAARKPPKAATTKTAGAASKRSSTKAAKKSTVAARKKAHTS